MKCTIDQLGTDAVVLRTEDGQELTVPIAELPDGASEGDVLIVRFGANAGATVDRDSRARDILNELLGSGDTTA